MSERSVLIIVILSFYILVFSITQAQTVNMQDALVTQQADTWVEVGSGSATGSGISFNSGSSNWPSAFFAPDNTLYVGWDDNSSGNREIYVRKWDGNSWQEVGNGSASGMGISNNSGESRGVALAVDHSGTLYAAWHDNSSGNYEIYVRRWNGSYWEEVGFGSATGGGISNSAGLSFWPTIAFAIDGAPYIAWGDNSAGPYEIYVRRFNGTTWAEVGANSASLGGISNTSGDSWSPEIEFMPDGRPIIAWNNGDANFKGEIYVRQWNGQEWVSFGINSDSGGGISNTPGDSQVPSFEITPAGIIYLSWQEDLLDGTQQAYVKKWDGSNWVEIGSGSAAGGGISNTIGETWWPTLALGLNGIPYVAWYDSSAGQYQIYIRRWDGTQWVEVGPHSASNGGISNNIGISGIGMIVVDSNSIPYMIWEDASNGNFEIYARRWNPSPCFELTTIHIGSGTDPLATASDSIDCAVNKYKAGEVVGLTSTPANGWEIVGWEGTNNNNSTSAENSVTMPAQNHTVKVIYEQSIICYQLTTTHTGAGSNPFTNPLNSSGCNTGSYVNGEVVQLSVDPATGWEVSGWSGTNNDASSSTDNTVTMPANDHIVRVDYEPLTSSLSYSYISLILTQPGFFLGPEEQEPNDLPTQANGPLLSNREYFGAFALSNDLDDYYYLNFPESRHIEIFLTDIPIGQDYNVILYDATSTNIIGYSGNLENANEYISELVNEGINYIRIYNQKPTISHSPYKLRVTYGSQ